MKDNERAADDVKTIKARLAEMQAERLPRRRGGGYAGDHCGHCPREDDEHCSLNCENEAKSQGWYLPELFER